MERKRKMYYNSVRSILLFLILIRIARDNLSEFIYPICQKFVLTKYD